MSNYQVNTFAINQMTLEMDSDVKKVMEFMQTNMAADRLIGVAAAVGNLAPILWGRYGHEEVHPLLFRYPSLQSAASGSIPAGGCADGGSGAAIGANALM